MKKLFLLLFFCFVTTVIFSQNTWVQKANFPVLFRSNAAAFSIGTKGYVCTGDSVNKTTKDLWEWDQVSNTWTQKADFGGTKRDSAVAFTIGNKGYVGLGGDGITPYPNDFWEYDPSGNTWSQISSFPGTPRSKPVAFSIGTKAYVGGGYYTSITILDLFWEYDQSNDTWTQKANIIQTDGAVGFSIGNKGYIGTGSNNQDFWEYEPSANTWTQKANFSGGSLRRDAAGFSIGNNGYIGTGYDFNGNTLVKDFWEYNSTSNTWMKRADMSGVNRKNAVGFSIGNKGYIGTGYDGNLMLNDFWEYSPCTTASPTITIMGSDTICQGDSVLLSSSDTAVNQQWYLNDTLIAGATSQTFWASKSGNYFVSSGCSFASLSIIITVLHNNSNPSICMVTVDSLSQNNVIMWDKTSYAHIDSFIIYREINASVYSPLGAVPYDSLSLFVDTVRTKYFPNTGNPNAGTYRYKLGMKDSCGNISTMSPYHNTIYILNNSGAFTWTQHYTIENAANPVISYFLMRDDLSNGNWHAIGSVSGTQQTIIDPNYLSYQSTASWRVETQWGISCNPSINFTKSRSNIFSLTTGVYEYYNNPSISISPNPFTETATLHIVNSNSVNYELKILDIYGREVMRSIIPKGENNFTIGRKGLASGMYFYRLTNENAIIATGKLIIK